MAEKLIIAKTAEEALQAKNATSAFLAGGTETERLGSLVHADTLILLKHIPDLNRIENKDGYFRIGAMCTFEEVLEAGPVPDYLKTALRFMASRTKRNMATIGGNISIFRSDSYLIATLIAAGAKLEIANASCAGNIVSVEEYGKDRKKYQDSLITALLLSQEPVTVFSKRYANTAESHAYLTVSMGKRGGKYKIGAAIKNSGVFSLTELAREMENDPSLSENTILDWCKSWSGAEIKDDMFGSEAYKRYLLGVTVAKMSSDMRGGDRR